MKPYKLKTFLFLNCVTSIMLAVFATVAWFKINNVVNGGEDIINIRDVDISLQYKFYKYDEFNEITSSTDYHVLRLNEYDSIIKSRNDYNPLIIEFEISGEEVAGGLNDLELTINCSNSTYNSQNISNITQYNILMMQPSATDEATYTNVLAAAKNQNTNYRFVTTQTNGNTKTYTKSNVISYIIQSQDYSPYFTGQNPQNSFTMYIVIDYAEDLIEEVFSDILGIATEDSDDSVGRFNNDLTSIQIAKYEN